MRTSEGGEPVIVNERRVGEKEGAAVDAVGRNSVRCAAGFVVRVVNGDEQTVESRVGFADERSGWMR